MSESFKTTKRPGVNIDAILGDSMKSAAAVRSYLAAVFTKDYQATIAEIDLVDVTLRDGLQQSDIYIGEIGENGKPMGLSVADRIKIFDSLVDCGIRIVEIGHLGNPADRPFAKALIQHTREKSKNDPRYKETQLQVLFGAVEEQVREGIQTLGNFDKNRVVVHVYDRISPGLRTMSRITAERAAERLMKASLVALEAGFTNFSVSGEGAVDHSQDPEVAIEFHQRTTRFLFENGARRVNVNVANTFGSSAHGLWDEIGLRAFDTAIKRLQDEFDDVVVTTSMHAHNDFGSSTETSLLAATAGFNRIESAFIGMGERAGNTPGLDVLTRLVETALIDIENIERLLSEGRKKPIESPALNRSLLVRRQLPQRLVDGLANNHRAGEQIGTIAHTERFRLTSLGNQLAYTAGSGPHGEGAHKYTENPLQAPYVTSYGRNSIVHSIQGSPDATKILDIDMETMRKVIILNHAAGGRTIRAHSDDIARAPDNEVAAHRDIVNARLALVRDYLAHNMEQS